MTIIVKKAWALSKGDKVAVVSLSGGMLGEDFCKHDIELGRKRLQEFGLEMVLMPNALKGIKYLKEHPEARASDLKAAFADCSIRGIICAIGGDDTYRLLPFLMNDAEFLKNVQDNPKVFTGFSDSTVNHLMFYKLGLITYYGPNLINDLAELADEMLPYTKDAFKRYLEGGNIPAPIRSSDFWYEERTDFSPEAIGTNRIYHKEIHGYEWITCKSSFQGKLLGGCLDTLYDLLVKDGAEKEACNKYGLFPTEECWNGKILFIETSENHMKPEKLEKILLELDRRGVLEKINGMLVGKPQDEIFYEEYKSVYKKVLMKYPNLPVVYNVNFGHAYPRTVMPYGVEVEVDNNKKEIRFLEEMVL